jgi:hypothetical protein
LESFIPPPLFHIGKFHPSSILPHWKVSSLPHYWTLESFIPPPFYHTGKFNPSLTIGH